MKKRFRMFAGPNGSGKSSLYEQLRRDGSIHTEIYIAADRIEKDLKEKRSFNFNAYRVRVDEIEFKSIAIKSGLSKDPNLDKLLKSLHLESGLLTVNNSKFINSYLAAGIAIYLTHKLLQSNQSFCFETVLSHESKIELLSEAKKNGYKTYLYFVFTDDPKKNKDRIVLREKAGGHGVPPEKIEKRYNESIENLLKAVKHSEESFIIDNSTYDNPYDVVAEIQKGKKFKAVKPGYNFKKKLPAFYNKFKKELK